MNRKVIQLLFPLLAVLPWPLGFVFFGDVDTGEAAQIEVATPSVTITTDAAGKDPAHVPVGRIDYELPSPYLKTAFATTYDGEEWLFTDVADHGEFVQLDLTRESKTGIRRNSPPISDGFDLAVLKEAKPLDDSSYLSLPGNISERVTNLARRITEGLESPFEKAAEIETFLRVRYRYDSGFKAAPSEWESTDWFLFEAQEGVCHHFNSAFVVLARAAGIPSRLVVGYYVEPGVDEQTVYSDQAHAWAEIGLNGAGWVTFDATPPAFKTVVEGRMS